MAGKVEARSETERLPEGQQQFAPPSGQVVPGIGAGESSIKPSGQGEPELQKSEEGEPISDKWSTVDEDEGEPVELRFCALLDYVLPTCVVQYLEQLCTAIYNYFAPPAGREPVYSPLPDLSDDEGAGSTKGDDSVDEETRLEAERRAEARRKAFIDAALD